MATFIEYTTLEGDRWDLIAFRMYGDAYAYEPIVAANPHVPVRPSIAAGVKLLIPVRAQSVVADASVPPWKR